MRKALLALTAASLLTIGGCAAERQAANPSAPTISAAAQSSLAAAQAAVKEAKARNALWTTAEDALKAAEAAEKKGDSAAVISNAQKAQDHARMGIRQTGYPLLQVKEL